jgi:hypothetical protein
MISSMLSCSFLNDLHAAWAMVLGLYAVHALVILRYVSNVAIGAFNFLRAWVGVYRPNGYTYIHSWWYCLDCLGNALAGGDPRETISSRAGKARANGVMWGCALCLVLGWIATLIFGKPTDHCAQSVEPTEGNLAVIPDGE